MFEIFIAVLGFVGILCTLYIINRGFKDTDDLVEYHYKIALQNLQKQSAYSKVVCKYCRSDLVLDKSNCCNGCGAPV